MWGVVAWWDEFHFRAPDAHSGDRRRGKDSRVFLTRPSPHPPPRNFGPWATRSHLPRRPAHPFEAGMEISSNNPISPMKLRHLFCCIAALLVLIPCPAGEQDFILDVPLELAGHGLTL